VCVCCGLCVPWQAASSRLEKLEGEIARLRRERAQSEALLKARRASEQRVKQLEGEIGQIKAQKVQVARRQREEADAHRAQRTARERELKQLRRKEEKQAATIAKLEGAQAQQAAVLKRKNDEIERLAAVQKKQRAFGHGPAAPGRPGAPGVGGAPAGGMAARKPGVGGGGPGGGTTAAFRGRLECKKEDDLNKAVSAMSAKPREWLDGEIKSIIAEQKLREEVRTERGAATWVVGVAIPAARGHDTPRAAAMTRRAHATHTASCGWVCRRLALR
jgi:flagellar biosynthesis GTPase FlhF